MAFPITRNRRLRRSAALRSMLREHTLQVEDFIYPIFVTHGENAREPLPSMPGVYHLSMDQLKLEIEEVVALGIQSVLILWVPHYDDEVGSSASVEEEIFQ